MTNDCAKQFDHTYFFLVVQTVVNIISKPPMKIAIAKPPATQLSQSVFSIRKSTRLLKQ